MYFLLLVSVLVFSPVVVCVDIIGPTHRAIWGTWGSMQYCPKGSYAAGYVMKIEPKQGDRDDTSLNGIMLVCSSLEGGLFGGTITSTVGRFGDWGEVIICPKYMFLKEFALQVEEYRHNGDDTAANYIKFRCGRMDSGDSGSCNYEIALTPGYGFWGVISGWSRACPPNSAICGIQTKVEDYQRNGDDTSLNDVKFMCCNGDSWKK
ncbi:vitelline membrane outer layer protein 1-like [Ruditapes philippinarum]|uniref:vitelline membrane outer layer protein 1-like n=1 Tax=Ruditapes philippinarum TaxID=129788 RepID=UPI00295A7905|nr:vitelline membrane outer layer protein 1-like [Ruditapes philippinarum]